MKCSRNELTALMRKAAIGSGCAIGVAGDIAQAACTLQAANYNGLMLFLSSLDALTEEHEQVSGQADSVDSRFSTVTIARQGPSVFDVLIAQNGTQKTALELGSIDVPFLLVGLAVNRCIVNCHTGISQKIELTFSNGARARVSNSAIMLCGDIPEASCSARVMFDTTAEPFVNSRAPAETTAALSVDEEQWHHCSRLAALTYVASTEASHLSGAGAGLTDND